ncbi:MAG: CheA signal transduction histidine kinase, partial [Chloroflexi bacterium]|nr:CheA signal transduction histidine kinase [Chloroflexota bacterium]
ADGDQALARALETRYALVVTGVETRGLRGLDLATSLRATPPYQKAAIIILSSDDNPVDHQRATDLGVTAYILRGSLSQQLLVENARTVFEGMSG